VPAVGLSALHVDPALRYIEQRGGAVRLGCAIERLETDGEAVAAIVTAADERLEFDGYVAALPPKELLQIVPEALHDQEPFVTLQQLTTSPIVNLHLWFDGPVAPFDFAAFVGTEMQWVFNRSRIGAEPGPVEHLVISLSAAAPFVALSKRELQERFMPQLQAALPRSRGRKLVRFVAIKEPEATFLAAPGLRRPGPRTPLSNLVLAGAYTDTGWPATMESAVRSGLAAARAVREEPAPTPNTTHGATDGRITGQSERAGSASKLTDQTGRSPEFSASMRTSRASWAARET
jgi:uncharacterized protein with NAD-binding domain and iron-sulfur cluster